MWGKNQVVPKATGILLTSFMKSLLMEYSLGSRTFSDSTVKIPPTVIIVSPLSLLVTSELSYSGLGLPYKLTFVCVAGREGL